MEKSTVLSLGNQTVRIDVGELVGYRVSENEFIHQKGSPGWRSSDTEMFPIIGPTNKANFRVLTPMGEAIQDQHGLLREMQYEVTQQTAAKVVFTKRYKANTVVHNSKFPQKSSEETLSWPYDFEFTKTFQLIDNGLEISFKIAGKIGMPYMLGYHPAFNLHTASATIKTNVKSISIAEVLAVGSSALHVPNCKKMVLSDRQPLEITTTGFTSFMLWTEVSNMVCIEPITFYPYAVAQENLHEGFSTLDGNSKEYTVFLKPLHN
ncbi:aldose epimerase family protein [Maribacter antarcticus]|uniref:aldose epimerase family protein n=1 Tax=Maribacter antarcticus TaxID=505250 RepID=UPI00047B52E1|nr:aldose epimerase [Maribacter antarcticus]